MKYELENQRVPTLTSTMEFLQQMILLHKGNDYASE